MKELLIGANVTFNLNTQLLGSVREALSYKSNTFMFYTGSNQSTLRCVIDDNLTYEAHKLMIENNINSNNVIVHAPFIINLANTTDKRKYNFYISFLKEEMIRCETLGIKKLVLHPGSRVTFSLEEAIDNIAFGLNQVLKEGIGTDILLEFMSGKGTETLSNIDEFKLLFDKIEDTSHLFVCLDTCHMNDSGIDIAKFDEFLDNFDKKIGIEKIKCIHVNDSNNLLGIKKDRHANIGYGTIGFQNLINVIYNKRLEDVPKILETPYINRNEKNEYPPYKYEIENIRNKEFIDFIKNQSI
ncbi:MAG: deoxyribonuclease IV [Bacilli bacterium]